MRFSYQIGMCDADHYLPLAQAVEAAGFQGITIPDSVCYPREASSKYPYNADGSREFLESVPFIESLIGVATMAAVTEKIRFSTFVYKLAIRQAAIVAKQVQSINRLSNNRFDFGVGISPWEEDFAVAQVPWEKRGKRLDEQIAIIRGLDSGDYFGYQGELHDMPPCKGEDPAERVEEAHPLVGRIAGDLEVGPDVEPAVVDLHHHVLNPFQQRFDGTLVPVVKALEDDDQVVRKPRLHGAVRGHEAFEAGQLVLGPQEVNDRGARRRTHPIRMVGHWPKRSASDSSTSKPSASADSGSLEPAQQGRGRGATRHARACGGELANR